MKFLFLFLLTLSSLAAAETGTIKNGSWKACNKESRCYEVSVESLKSSAFTPDSWYAKKIQIKVMSLNRGVLEEVTANEGKWNSTKNEWVLRDPKSSTKMLNGGVVFFQTDKLTFER